MLLPLMFHHRGALEYDLMPAPFDTDDIEEGRVSWNKAWRIVSEILRDPYAHSVAALQGWGYVPHPSDVLFLNWVDATAMMHHKKGTVQPKPARRPWQETQRDRPKQLPDPERPQRRAALRERLGLS